MIKEEYDNLLAADRPEDVDALEDNWGVGNKQLVKKIDHNKANQVKESKTRPRKLQLRELKSMILTSLNEHRINKVNKVRKVKEANKSRRFR